MKLHHLLYLLSKFIKLNNFDIFDLFKLIMLEDS